MWDQDLENHELDFLTERVEQYKLSSRREVVKDIVKMIHTSLFGYKRCHHVQLDNNDLCVLADELLTKPKARHYKKAVNEYVLTFYLECRFNDQKDDVEYYIKTDGFNFIKYEHHKKVVSLINECVINAVSEIRQQARIYYRKLWKNYREHLEEEGVV